MVHQRPNQQLEGPGQHDHAQEGGYFDGCHALNRQPGGQGDVEQPLGNTLGELGQSAGEIAHTRAGRQEPSWIVHYLYRSSAVNDVRIYITTQPNHWQLFRIDTLTYRAGNVCVLAGRQINDASNRTYLADTPAFIDLAGAR